MYYRGKYIGSQTNSRVQKSWQESHKRPNKFLNQSNVSYFVECELKKGYSPEIICQELKESFGEIVSHETLYIYIYSSPKGIKEYLLRRPFGRKPRQTERPKRQDTGKNIPNRIDISERPIEADERLEFGYFEADSIE